MTYKYTMIGWLQTSLKWIIQVCSLRHPTKDFLKSQINIQLTLDLEKMIFSNVAPSTRVTSWNRKAKSMRDVDKRRNESSMDVALSRWPNRGTA